MGWGEEFIGGMVGCRGRSGGGGGGGPDPPTHPMYTNCLNASPASGSTPGWETMFPLDGYLLRFLPFLQLIALTKHLTENLKKAYYLMQKCAED